MPIVTDGKAGFVLVCLNNHRTPSGGTTMVAIDDWLSIPTTAAPGHPAYGRLGMMLRCYYCSVCGYAEMYVPQQGEPGVRGV
jgi:hypothetical protein